MNYKESLEILEEIKKADKILLNCHLGPDSDSVGSALAMRDVLLGMGKSVEVICPSKLPTDLLFLEGSDQIKQEIDFSSFDFSKFDLLIAMDSSTYGMVSDIRTIEQPPIKTIVMDHHYTNSGYGNINLIDSKVTSTAELVYKVFSDWNVSLDKRIATKLLTGIMGDTGCFQWGGVDKTTFDIAGKLMELGASKDEIVFNIYKSIEFLTIKFWGKIIDGMQIDSEYKFAWSAVRYEVYKEHGEDSSAKEDASNLFAPVVSGTDFGLIMVESQKDKLSVSFRSRTNFDVSKIAQEIGGGGHIAAAGGKVELPFEEAVEKVLTACRKYANSEN